MVLRGVSKEALSLFTESTLCLNSRKKVGGWQITRVPCMSTLAPLIFVSFVSQMLPPRSVSSSAIPCNAFSCCPSKCIGLFLGMVHFALYNGSLANKDLKTQAVLMSHQTGFVVTKVIPGSCSGVNKSQTVFFFILESYLASRCRAEGWLPCHVWF